MAYHSTHAQYSVSTNIDSIYLRKVYTIYGTKYATFSYFARTDRTSGTGTKTAMKLIVLLAMYLFAVVCAGMFIY